MTAAPSTMQWLRRAAQRISRGSGRLTLWLARRITRRGAARLQAWGSSVTGWLGQASGFEWLFRLGCLVGLGLVARRMLLALSHGALAHVDAVASRLMWPASIVWLVVAYRIGREDWRPRGEPDQVEQQPAVEHTEPCPDAEPDEPALPTREQLAASLARVGTPHAHIAVLADDLGAPAEHVRAALDRHGVPVTPVRMRGRGSSTGIKGGSLPAPTSPPVGVVAAGHAANNDNNNATTVRTRKGVVIITDDAHNRYRHHVHHAKG
ncbi:hypothetical protein ABZ330_21710 [Streptomyces sp. NPDC006172]|uniref:hypothetical protein n=1 Tax=Streptomyces sp. NPDC006172 TaxID=3154470 RepID=UPI0033FFC39C